MAILQREPLADAHSVALVKDLRATFAKMEMALGAIRESIVWTDDRGQVQWCNAAFDRLVGREHIEVLSDNLMRLLPLGRKGQSLFPDEHPVRLALSGGDRTAGVYEFKGAHGNVVLEICSCRVELSSQEVSVVFAIHDVTERQRAEEQLTQTLKDLQKSHEEFKTTQGQLIQAGKMEAIGQLASGVAHEVRNPLAIILQGIDFLEREVGSGSKDALEALRMIRQAAFRADKIIRGLLSFAKAGELELHALPMAQVIDTSLDLVSKQMAFKDVQVTREIPRNLPLAMADENQMIQVFINLFLNAVQSMPSGGKLAVQCFAKKMTQPGNGVGVRRSAVFKVGQTVLVCQIEDTGVGIPEEKLCKVFDPFFTTKPPGEGTGLGLAITKTIVERHRGFISIESEEGRGTRVTVMLPLAQGG